MRPTLVLGTALAISLATAALAPVAAASDTFCFGLDELECCDANEPQFFARLNCYTCVVTGNGWDSVTNICHAY